MLDEGLWGVGVMLTGDAGCDVDQGDGFRRYESLRCAG